MTRTLLLRQRFIQIPPSGIHRLDQRELPLAAAALNLFLARYRPIHLVVWLVPDQFLAAIGVCEAFQQALAMLIGAAGQVGGDAGVDGAVAFVCHDIDTRSLNENPSMSLRGAEGDGRPLPPRLAPLDCIASLAMTASLRVSVKYRAPRQPSLR